MDLFIYRNSFFSLSALCLALFFSNGARAFSIPTNLKNSQLTTLSNALGHGTSNKFLSNPYPLGGFSGVELGVGAEFINTSDFSSLGSGSATQSSVEVDRLSIGKGLYGGLDIFLNFIPFSGANEVSSYGASIKWTFFEGQFLPLTLSTLVHYDSINFGDQFMSEDYGADLIAGINVNHVSLYMGGGTISGRHVFSKSILDLTDVANNSDLSDNRSLVNVDHQTHGLIGVQTEISNFFLAAEIDRYANPVYSAKLGLRY